MDLPICLRTPMPGSSAPGPSRVNSANNSVTAVAQAVAPFIQIALKELANPKNNVMPMMWKLADVQGFQEIYEDFTSSQKDRDAKFLNWIKKHPNAFSKAIFDSLPYLIRCQLAVMMTEGVRNSEDLPLNLSQDINTLPLELDRLGIVDLPSEVIAPERLYTIDSYEVSPYGVIALAAIINYRKLDPVTLVAGIEFLKPERKDQLLLDMAPYLIYLDLSSDGEACELRNKDIANFVKRCFNVVYLNVSDTGITTISSLEKCKTLICNDCKKLNTIENLPVCTSLDCSGCPLLTNIDPAIPARRFEINFFELQQNPLKYLIELGERFLLGNQPAPVICYTGNVFPDAKYSFIHVLFKDLFLRSTLPKTTNPLLPMMDEEGTLENVYKTMGILFAYCYEGKNTAFSKMESIFDETFFILLTLLSEENVSSDNLINSYLMIKVPSDDVIDAIHDKLNKPFLKKNSSKEFNEAWSLLFSNKPQDVSEKDYLIAKAREDLSIKAIHRIAREMQNSLSPEFQERFSQDEPEAIKKIIENGRNSSH